MLREVRMELRIFKTSGKQEQEANNMFKPLCKFEGFKGGCGGLNAQGHTLISL